jgi:hypothetical protein
MRVSLKLKLAQTKRDNEQPLLVLGMQQESATYEKTIAITHFESQLCLSGYTPEKAQAPLLLLQARSSRVPQLVQTEHRCQQPALRFIASSRKCSEF